MEELKDLVQGLEEPDFQVLEELRRGGSATPTRVSIQLDNSKIDVKHCLYRLRDKGLVTSIPLESRYEKELYRINTNGQAVLNFAREFTLGTLGNIG